MKILHVIDQTGPGGAQVLLGSLLKKLRQDFDFHVAVLGQSGQFSQTYRNLGITVHEIGRNIGKYNPCPILSLIHIIQQGDFDLVHTHLYKSHIIGGIAASLLGKRIVIQDHSAISAKRLTYVFSTQAIILGYLFLYGLILRRSSCVLVLTEEDRKRYLTDFRTSSTRLIIVPNAIDLECVDQSLKENNSLRQELDISEADRLVVMVGRLEPEKDWHTFLRVAQKISINLQQVCWFLVIGSGSLEQDLRDYVIHHSISNIKFLGYRNDVYKILHQSDVFLFTSQQEAFGIALLEAMACRCPVIATMSTGPSSIITHDYNGLLCQVGDVEDLSKQTQKLLGNSGYANQLAANAFTTVQGHYQMQNRMEQMRMIYRRFAENGEFSFG